MDYYREFKKEVSNIDRTWKLSEKHEGFQHIYFKFMNRTRLTYRVLKKLHKYKRNREIIEAIETIIEDVQLEIVRTIKRQLNLPYSLKVKCKIQIQNWALEIIRLIDTECSKTILDEKLIPSQYHKTIPPSEQFSAKQIDGKLFTYTNKLEKYKTTFYLPDGRFTNFINNKTLIHQVL